MPANKSIWVVTTDTNTCRIYDYRKKPVQLILIKEIEHPENKLKNKDLTSGKPGRFKSKGSPLSSFSQPSDPKEIKIDDFSREITKELDHGRTIQAYKNIVLIAPPHMNGLLLKHMNKHVENLITHTIEKDLLHLSNHELLDFLNIHTKYPNE